MTKFLLSLISKLNFFAAKVEPAPPCLKVEDNGIPTIGRKLSKRSLYTIEVVRKWELGDYKEASFGHCVYSFILDSGKRTDAGIVELVEARDALKEKGLYRKAKKNEVLAEVINFSDASKERQPA